jgi:hypothetical protein
MLTLTDASFLVKGGNYFEQAKITFSAIIFLRLCILLSSSVLCFLCCTRHSQNLREFFFKWWNFCQEQNTLFNNQVDKCLKCHFSEDFFFVGRSMLIKFSIVCWCWWNLFVCLLLVLWNPWDEKAKAMADMDDDGWQHFVCVEAGAVSTPVALEPDQTFECKMSFAIGEGPSCCSNKK